MNNISSFIDKIPGAKFYTQSFYRNYLHALDLYANHQLREAKDFVGKVITEEFEHEHILLFYRLWLEAAAEDHDRITLQMLKNHLGNMAPLYQDYDQWVALRGLIHWELEELDACLLLLRGLEGNAFNPYALELQQRYVLRTYPDRQVPETLLAVKAPVIDYFTMQSAARILLANAHLDALQLLLDKVNLALPQTPMVDQFHFVEAYEENHLNEAEKYARRLCKRFPKNEEFRFNLAYCCLVQNKVMPAMQLLTEGPASQRSGDPDIGSLLGFAHLLQSNDKPTSHDWKEARHYLSMARRARKIKGLPTSDLDLNLLYMKNREGKGAPITYDKFSFWIMPLSPRRFHELSTVEENEVEHLYRSVGKNTKLGDYLCFSSSHKTDMRILAIYKIVARIPWHPFEKNHSILELVERFPQPVRTSINMKPMKDGSFKLSQEDVETLITEIEEHYPVRQKLRSPIPRKPIWQLQRAS